MQRFEDIYPDHPKGGLFYLASPYEAHPRGHYLAYMEARHAVAQLWKADVDAFSPVAATYSTVEWEQVHKPHEWWMRWDGHHMRNSVGLIVLMLDGWQKSEGVAEEIAFFEKRNSPIFSLAWPLGKL